MITSDDIFQQLLAEKRQYFPETKLELPLQKPVYTVKTLSLEDMDKAVEEEAGLRVKEETLSSHVVLIEEALSPNPSPQMGEELKEGNFA
ncbi:MAG: hypothetical protein ACH34X_09125 [Thiolinea sp.]